MVRDAGLRPLLTMRPGEAVLRRCASLGWNDGGGRLESKTLQKLDDPVKPCEGFRVFRVQMRNREK